MQFLSGLFGCFCLKFKINLKTVATTATNAEMGTASAMLSWKNISMIGILLPAPESPPAFDKAIKMNMRTNPILSMTGFMNGTFLRDNSDTSYDSAAGAGSSSAAAGASPSSPPLSWTNPFGDSAFKATS